MRIALRLFLIAFALCFTLQAEAQKKKKNYKEKEVTFTNKKDNVTLSGTLTLPKKGNVLGAIVLISGSGPSDRDESIYNKHRPFKIIAEYLSSQGYAVLRYDDRGCGKSTGKPFPWHTSADLGSDVKAAVDFLKTQKEIDSTKIGIMGHSEGGMIAAMIASKYSDIAFVVSIAGAGCRIIPVMEQQNRGMLQMMKKDSIGIENYMKYCYSPVAEIIATENDSLKASERIALVLSEYKKNVPAKEYEEFAGKSDKNFVTMFMGQAYNPWFRYFMGYNTEADWKKVHQPVLAINGTKDVQVDAKQNLTCISDCLTQAGNKNFKVVYLDGYNHMFQKTQTGLMIEYMSDNPTFPQEVLTTMSDWLKATIH